ncbi:ImmA/IrrE family metallo-endopeptidase [Streptobacillus ratti]|uniref:ImmA/IrrE family metallo-endopeptidase n=1 Tax=Streptobacillus ratti TaxID=1720557 RepID=UPI000933300A|nr:ImmA/IrrE family metallo-endopeptidase [Streptobacillus ratti]
MKNNEVIKISKELKHHYNSNIFELIKDNKIIVNYAELKKCKGFSTICEDYQMIVINDNLEEYEKDFILAHELGHSLFHDKNLRYFSNICDSRDKCELQANLFATIFLGYEYQDNLNDCPIQKIVNYIHCNFLNNYIDIKEID